MIAWLLGTVYGIGFGLSVCGSIPHLMVLNGLKKPTAWQLRRRVLLMLLCCLIWPISWAVIAYKLYRVYMENP